MATRVGSGKWTYEPVPNWGRSAKRPEFGIVSGLAGDSHDNLYLFQRTVEPSVLVFDREGREINQWGLGDFGHPHGIWIGPDATRNNEEVVLLTDRDRHQVVKYTLAGGRIATWGFFREPGDAGQPFNQPARATLGPSGEMFVADGYGGYRVHRFNPDGGLARSWGKRGTGNSEFGWPVHHAILDARGRLLVIDRGNNRFQFFTPDGDYLSEWGGLHMPQDLAFGADGELVVVEGNGPSVAVLSPEGEVLCRWGERGEGPGQFGGSPHSVWIDSHGDLYVGEVTPPNLFQKFIRR
jgi:hypothetical protein